MRAQMRTQTVPATQRGAVLIVSLILLLVLTVLAVGGMQSTTLQEKMAGNARDQQLALQAAEAALREGEEDNVDLLDFNLAGVYKDDQAPDYKASSTWTPSGSFGYSGSLKGVASQPRYLMQPYGPVSASDDSKTTGNDYQDRGRWALKIVGRGEGANGAEAIVESSFIILRD